MFDIKAIRDDAGAFDAGLAKRGLAPQAARLIEIDERRRAIITSLQELQQRRNDASKQIGQAKAKKDDALAQSLMEEVASIKSAIQEGEEKERAANAEIEAALASIPNIPFDDVPVGPDESANVIRHSHGKAREMNFAPKEHFDLGEALGLMDFEAAAKMSGARFTVLKGQLARLERAIGNFMVDLHTTEFGYEEVAPPLMVRDDAMFGTAQLPKFEDDQFATFKGLARDDQEKYWLIPTAEVPLTNLVRESILSEEELPKRFTAYTACFRAEAGSAGRDTRGMIRQHQFSKVELVSITTPEKSREEHERMLSCAEEVLKRLDLHYRVMTLSTGDMGFASRKTYDIEVWLPGQNAFREISSCSVCGDFQARRMNARYRPKGEKNTRFVHTLNGSGLAVGRALVAVMENYQQADGSITVPTALQPYMGGQEVIAVHG
ncbi:seryl-tRNA synthetase [Parvibaculum lavamentivorans DS-1]|uniref:Serine--tRNA ligase n=1 Tax=Parvibaculum lavamentivorans (strain DS-1 / DSM 13023 / NCIMB 13966) TaxID=402881 RepID=SYS_PARL1|nr:serine--tRNA ligase [Parvibaculum lavamentivorans]A7HXK4.1 RecName: Full=Serine--tRNA ligase; AltName: Full=Seryl-tRNA synthetase; Short=SerRS; AltName: Full=Seryl-tRNA(Ser/Sec) synthetase [Parvibaculum lavamentivorans DS-1]ABS64637.1 seryl-tRNA synthetase [Parvibaculum lavamentivorans DS-1]